MSGFSNVVRFIVKEGCETDFLEVFKTFCKQEGEIYSFLVQTGDREYVAVGTWAVSYTHLTLPTIVRV